MTDPKLQIDIQIYKNMNKVIEKELSYKVGGIFFEVQDELGRFARERQYADLLEKKLSDAGMAFKRELPIEIAGRKSNFIDFIIEDRILIDLKAKPFIKKDDYYQMKRYLQSANKELGIIVNFRDEYLKPRRVLNSKFVDSDKMFVGLDRSNGFTIVELLVAITLFLVVVSIAAGTFIQALRTQRATVALIAANSNASLAMEQMGREIRTGKEFFLNGGELNFTNAKGQAIAYRLRNESIEKAVNGEAGAITASNVKVSKLNFVLTGESANDGWPSRITLILEIGSPGAAGAKINLQTTISARLP